MGKLIDIDDIFGEKVIMVSQNAYDEVMKLMRMIREAPEVYAVPVVRCKDCKWYEIAYLKRDGTADKRYKPSMCMIGTYAKPRKADWYCADGERREDEVLRMPPADGSTIPAAYLVNCENCLQVTEKPGNDICKACGGRRGQDATRVEESDLRDLRE